MTPKAAPPPRRRLSLRTQLVASFAGLALLVAAATGLPAIWLADTQLERQAWAEVDQAGHVARALYAAQRSEIEGLATLTSQRPTLQDLLRRDDRVLFISYLRTLQLGAGLDVIVACDQSSRLLAQVGDSVPGTICQTDSRQSFLVSTDGSVTRAWMLARYAVADGALGEVVVGVALDYEFAARMRTQTGLEHLILAVDGQPVATSLAGGLGALAAAHSRPGDGPAHHILALNGETYYAASVPLDTPDLAAEVALPVTDIVEARRRLTWALAGGLLAVAGLGSLLGAWLARQISRPLAGLSASAARLSQGDLERPVEVETQTREVTLLAESLERARADLRQTLADLRREKTWSEHLLQAVVEGIVTLDGAGRVTFFSDGAERITGWSRAQVMGRVCDEVFRLADTAEPFSALIPMPGRRTKLTLTARDGRSLTLAVTGARLLPPAAGGARVALVFRDVSDEEAVHRLLGHFLANVAHEFRTPLSALAASLELLMDQAPDLRPDELQSLLTSLHLGLFSLQTLVDNLLEGASIETGHFRVSPRAADLREIVFEAARLVQPLLDKHGQQLHVAMPEALPPVRADSRRVVQVLVNLLSNANKYGPADAEIDVDLTVDANQVRLAVADHGPGVPVGYRQDLFRRFTYPADGKAQYGAGLGLSIVKAVVEAHGGQVGVDDRAGGGSAFWFTLPLAVPVGPTGQT